MSFPTPAELGLPDKFSSWFPNQLDAAMEIDNCERPYITQVNGTGSGKTLIYVSAAYMSGSRTVILTSTKGLQSQLLNDFHSIGLVDIRGKNAYQCRKEKDGSTCDHGPCIAGYKCEYKSGGCKYFDVLRRAKSARIVSTNYSCWMHNNIHGEGFGSFDMMVCDEAHNLPDLISDFLTVSIKTSNPYIIQILPADYTSYKYEDWTAWAKGIEDRVHGDVESLRSEILMGRADKDTRRLLSQLLSFERTLKVLLRLNNNWIIDYSIKDCVSFAPIWPRKFSKEVLFFDIPKILLTSATVCKKTLDMVGIESDESVFTEYPNPFPAINRRLIHIPTIRLNRYTTPSMFKNWLSRIDQILRMRMDRKGLIHTVSYARRNEIIGYSEFRKYMITHETKTAVNAVHSFKHASAPAFLVSPSMTTGWDFPGDECRFQIIGKISYPDTRNKIIKARCDQDKEYAGYIAMQHLIQTCGRGMRYLTDWVENLIVDDSVTWFMKRNKKFAPSWFVSSFVSKKMIPQPPVKKIV